jgi:hypothetical protein
MADAVTKLLIEKGVISEAEFKEQLLKERATYQRFYRTRSHTDDGSTSAGHPGSRSVGV